MVRLKELDEEVTQLEMEMAEEYRRLMLRAQERSAQILKARHDVLVCVHSSRLAWVHSLNGVDGGR